MRGRILPRTLLLAAIACGPRAEGPAPIASSATTGAAVVTMEIAPASVPCTGVAPQRCLRVRIAPDTAWTLFHSSIEGFTYEEGYRWRLEVERTRIPDPPADGSSLRYRLLRVLSRSAER